MKHGTERSRPCGFPRRPPRAITLYFLVTTLLCTAEPPPAAATTIEVLLRVQVPRDDLHRIVVNRAGDAATGFRREGRDTFIFVSREGLVVTEAIPRGRLSSFEISNWGVAVRTNESGTDRIFVAPLGGALSEIDDDHVLGNPRLNDEGRLLYTGRNTTRHGMRDAYYALPGASPELLPELGEDSLGGYGLDSLGRVVLHHSFALEEGGRKSVYRFTPGGSWEDLFADISQAQIDNVWETNAAGDFIFSTRERPSSEVMEYWLWVYRSDTGEATRLLQANAGEPPIFEYLRPAIADDGRILVVLGTGWEADPLEVIGIEGDSTVSLEKVLPSGYTFPRNPAITMNFEGDLLLEGVTGSGTHGYFLHDGNRTLHVLTGLRERPAFLQHTNEGTVYIWFRELEAWALVRIVTVEGRQKPGDFNRDGELDLSDAMSYTSFLFLEPVHPLPCSSRSANLKALDVNDDGNIDISDPVYVLRHLFLGSSPPFSGSECIPIIDCSGSLTCEVP